MAVFIIEAPIFLCVDLAGGDQAFRMSKGLGADLQSPGLELRIKGILFLRSFERSGVLFAVRSGRFLCPIFRRIPHGLELAFIFAGNPENEIDTFVIMFFVAILSGEFLVFSRILQPA